MKYRALVHLGGPRETVGDGENAYARTETEDARDESEDEALGEDLRKDRQRSADGAADDLLRAFAYQYQHDVADAHDAREQCAQTYDPRSREMPSKSPVIFPNISRCSWKIDRLLVVGAIRCRGDALPALLDHLFGSVRPHIR